MSDYRGRGPSVPVLSRSAAIESGVDLVVWDIDRSEVNALIFPIEMRQAEMWHLGVLTRWAIAFTGYEDDDREVFEIPEIRAWCREFMRMPGYFLRLQLEVGDNSAFIGRWGMLAASGLIIGSAPWGPSAPIAWSAECTSGEIRARVLCGTRDDVDWCMSTSRWASGPTLHDPETATMITYRAGWPNGPAHAAGPDKRPDKSTGPDTDRATESE